MTVKLTSNFLANARGLTFLDSASVTWALNANTNQLTATATGGAGGGLTSVGLADTSTAPIYAVSNSPLIANGTLDITLVNQNANKIFAGPTSGGAAQPTFRAMVVGDMATGYPYSSLSGAPSLLTSPLTTKGDLWGYDTGNDRVPVGADGTVLTADSTQALGLRWGTPAAGADTTLTWMAS